MHGRERGGHLAPCSASVRFIFHHHNDRAWPAARGGKEGRCAPKEGSPFSLQPGMKGLHKGEKGFTPTSETTLLSLR